MRRMLPFAVLVALSVMLAGRAQAQAKLTSTGTNYGSWREVRSVPIDPEHVAVQVELMGIRLDDSGTGPFHQVATHMLMLVFIDKGTVSYHGIETHTDKDGDKVIWETSGGGKGEDKGKARVLAGTGKFAGIEGTMEYVTTPLRPFPEATGRTMCKESIAVVLKKPLS